MPPNTPAAPQGGVAPRMLRDPADRRVTGIEVGTRDGLQIEPALAPTARKIAIVESGIRETEVTSFVRRRPCRSSPTRKRCCAASASAPTPT